MSPRLDLMALLAPGPEDPLLKAEKVGWRAFIMGHQGSGHRRGGRLDAAWRRGHAAAARSANPGLGMP